jgi:hypothetical protein
MDQELLDIAYRVIASGKNSYLVLQSELLQITSADICICSVSESRFTDLHHSYRNGIGLRQSEEYINSLAKKINYQNKKDGNSLFSLRRFWKRNNRYQSAFALVIGASTNLATQLNTREYYLSVTLESSSERLNPTADLEEAINHSPISVTVKERDYLKFTGQINLQQILLPNQYPEAYFSSLRDDLISVAEYHLLPPYPFSVISIPLGFTYSTNFQDKEFIAIGLAWFGTEKAYAIDLDINIIDRAVQLCRLVAHEVITNSIALTHLLHILWDIDSLVQNAGLTPREKEALILILQDYDDAQIKQYFAPCEKTGRPGINTNSVTQLLQKLRDKIKSHLQGNEATRRRLQEKNITLNSFPTSIVKRALMCSEYYRGDK